ncbi:MAG: CoA transferase, partial [Chloroflexi bacterium]|nr:CoA transferase [Chloroflexota bacterium]
HEAELDALLAAWCATQDAAAVEAALGARGVAAARVVSLYDAYNEPNPNFTARGFVVPVTHPESGVNMLPGAPWKIDGVRPGPLRPSPGVGEHSRQVLREELAITDEEYDALVASGTTGTLYESA